MNMNRISIPYEDHMFNDIAQNGAIVNMNEINLPDIEEGSQKKFSFIYLRNTGLNVTLDFSDCSYDDKVEFLILFLTGNISLRSSILASTWIEIFASFDGGGINLPCILNEEEIKIFIKNHRCLVNEFIKIIISLPVFSLFLSPLNENKYHMDEFEHSDYDNINIDNFSQLLEFDVFSYIISANHQQKPLFYDHIFIRTNYSLANNLNKLPYFNILHGIFNMDSKMMEDFVNGINNFFETTRMEVTESDEL